MRVHSAESIDDELHRHVYEYVERRGAVERSELARSITVDAPSPPSKPARSGTDTESARPPVADLESAIQTLKEQGYLAETGGKLRLALETTPTTLETDDGAVTIRPAREADRDGIVETMRTVADESTYVVAEPVACRLERDDPLRRATGEQSQVCFAATRAAGDDGDGDRADGDPSVVGWLHLEGHDLEPLAHVADLTVGVAPDHRRQGIGSGLLEYGREWAADAGYRKLTQEVPATNDDAIAFLEAAGWHRECVRADQYRIDDAFVDAVAMATRP